jgi:hypothetical protein
MQSNFTTLQNINDKLSLAEEYKQKQREMDDRLKREIESHKIGAVILPKNSSEAPRALQPIKGMEN